MGSCMMMAEMKPTRVEICLQRYKNEDEEFLHNIVTGKKHGGLIVNLKPSISPWNIITKAHM
jgi:hypothetical protein